MTLPGALSPYHRDDRDYLWIDMTGRLGDGATLASAAATISRRLPSGTYDDLTADFGDPPAVVNPATTTDEAGLVVGGTGWVRVGPLAPGNVDRGEYVLKVDLTLGDGRVRVETIYLPVVDTGDPAPFDA